jgi:hypothetical protein
MELKNPRRGFSGESLLRGLLGAVIAPICERKDEKTFRALLFRSYCRRCRDALAGLCRTATIGPASRPADFLTRHTKGTGEQFC